MCTPYNPPSKVYLSLEDLVRGPLPQFGYQIHLASGEVEKSVNDEQSIRQFLKALYGAKGPKGEVGFDPSSGVLVENLSILGDSRVLNGEVWDSMHLVTQPFAHQVSCWTTTSRSIPATEFTAPVRAHGHCFGKLDLLRLTNISELVPDEKGELGGRSCVSLSPFSSADARA